MLPPNTAFLTKGCNLFTKLDLGSAFLSFRLHPSQQRLYSIECPLTKRRFKYTRIIWGSNSAPAALVCVLSDLVYAIARVIAKYPNFNFASASYDEIN